MRRKLFTLIAALTLVLTTTVSPIKVAAQGLVEYMILIVVVGIGTDQGLELYWYPRPSPPDHPPSDRVFFNYHYFVNATNPGPTSGGQPCTQTVQTTVEAHPGFNTLNVRMGEGNESLLINGKVVALSDHACFNTETKRVVLAVGVPVPPEMAERQASDDRSFDAEFSYQLARRYSIVGPDGLTVATSSTVSPRGRPLFFPLVNN